jgi:hypothetical protein
MWTDTTGAQYARADLDLPSDLTDAEWALLGSFFPPPSHVDRPRKWPLRRIIEAIISVPCASRGRLVPLDRVTLPSTRATQTNRYASIHDLFIHCIA